MIIYYELTGKSCGFALGMQDGKIKDEQLSSSSDYSMYHSAARGRLGNSPKQNGEDVENYSFYPLNSPTVHWNVN